MDPTDHDLLITLIANVAALDRLINERAEHDKAAVALAARDLDSRLEKLNEFRNALSDAQALMMPRSEVIGLMTLYREKLDLLSSDITHFLRTDVYETQHLSLTNRVESLELWRTIVNARVAVFVAIGVLGGGAIGTLISQLLK